MHFFFSGILLVKIHATNNTRDLRGNCYVRFSCPYSKDTILAKRKMLVDFNLQELCLIFAEARIFPDFALFSEFSRTALPFSTEKKKNLAAVKGKRSSKRLFINGNPKPPRLVSSIHLRKVTLKTRRMYQTQKSKNALTRSKHRVRVVQKHNKSLNPKSITQ